MTISRRDFLRTGALTAVGLGLSDSLLASINRRRLQLANPAAAAVGGEKVLVVINMFGGNDGVNTVIPLTPSQYALYRALRPTLGFQPGVALSLDGVPDFGLNPGMTALQALYAQGKVAIINGVGVPPTATGLFDHSAGQFEFQSCDIVRSATGPAPSGWVGRYLDTVGDTPASPGIDMGGGRLMLTGSAFTPLTINSINELQVQVSFDGDARLTAYQNIMNMPNTESGVAERNRKLRLETLEQSRIIRDGTQSYIPLANYPGSYLGYQLFQCAQLINADLGIQGLAVGTGGFDTHGGQNGGVGNGSLGYHDTLLQDVSDSIAAFYADLAAHGHAGRVLILTISEFGRRAYENNNRGTDHGLGSVAFAVGDPVKKGIYGTYPSLADADLVFDGSADVTTDFRSVYATAIANFMGVVPEPIVGGTFPLLGFV